MTGSEFIDVSGLLNPKSVAVIGAPDRTGNTLRHLLRLGFPGRVWTVNPHTTTVQGAPCGTFEVNPVMWQRSSVVAAGGLLVTKE
jgi:hypothetical protein